MEKNCLNCYIAHKCLLDFDKCDIEKNWRDFFEWYRGD